MLSKTLRTLLKPLQNEEAALWQKNYLRGQFPFLGVKTPLLRKAIAELRKIYPSTDWKEETLALWQEPEREFHHAAIFWAIAHRKLAKPNDLSLYEKLVVENSWWDTVDTVSPHLIGALFHAYPELLTRSEEWLKSDQLWLKRAALIYPLHRRKAIDSKRLFHYCRQLAHEKDFFIRKAIGWMLREHSKTDPESVKQFIESTELSPLSRREGLKYV